MKWRDETELDKIRKGEERREKRRVGVMGGLVYLQDVTSIYSFTHFMSNV